MRIDTLIGLVRETSVGADGKSFDRLEQSAPRQVFAAVKSVTRAEFYAAFTAGMSVDIVFELLAGDYAGENVVIYEGRQYSVVRTYRKGPDRMELTAAGR